MVKKRLAIILSSVCLVLVIVGVCMWVFLSSNGSYKGTVTQSDTNTPVANVCVSDGRNVVKTNEDGEFELKGWRKSKFITVTTPSGYVAESFYIPIEKDKKSYDFKLKKDDRLAQDNHSFLQISDTEIGEKGVGEWINEVKEIADREKPAFLIHTGDICYEEGLKKHLSEMNSENMGLPVYYTIGNHDYVDGDYGEQLYESIYGPVWYSFDVGNVHYVVTPFQQGADYSSGYGKNDRWRWLANDLAQVSSDKKVVMFNHTKSPNDDYVFSFDMKKLDLKEHNLIAWIFGHYHYNLVYENNGVVNISTGRPDCGGIDSSVDTSRLVSITDGKVSTKMFYGNSDKPAAEPDNAKWVTQLDGNCLFSDPLVVGNKIYVATVCDDYPIDCGVYCINADDGSIVWEYKTKNSVKSNIRFSNDKIIVQDTEANVYIFDANSDEPNPEIVKAPVGTSINTSSSICIDEGVAYVGSASAVSAINIDDGEILWSNERNHGENSPAEFIVCEDKVIVSSHWDALVALDKKNGKQIWENKDETIRFRSSTPVVIDNETLLVADSNAIMTVNTKDGKIINKTEFDEYSFSSSSQPYIENGTAYIATANKGVIAYDLKTFEVLWETPVKTALLYTSPYSNGDAMTVESSFVSVGDSLLFASSDGYVYTVNKSDGKITDEKFVGASVLNTPVVYENSVIVSDFSGRIIKF